MLSFSWLSWLSWLSWHGRAGGFTEKRLGFPQRLFQRDRAMSFLQQVDQVAILPRRIVDPGAGFVPTLSLQPDDETLPLCARGVGNLPMSALRLSGTDWRLKLSASSSRLAKRTAMLCRVLTHRHQMR